MGCASAAADRRHCRRQTAETVPYRESHRKKSLSHRRAAAQQRQGGHRWQAPRLVSKGSVSHDGAPGARVHWPRTLAAKRDRALAAPHLRYRHVSARGGELHCIVLDCSASMLQGDQLALAKGVLVRLIERAYQARADVALVCFAAGQAEVRLAPSRARRWNDDWIRPIAGGGGTPLALGAARADQLLARQARLRPAQRRWLWLLSDGRTTETPSRPAWADHIVVVDVERQALALGRCQQLAQGWDAEYRSAETLTL
ncbi:VWA domain-containing protein [Cupriavidus pauculus]|nr:VWA domain-containing protein [Cupriavidus pauculus]